MSLRASDQSPERALAQVLTIFDPDFFASDAGNTNTSGKVRTYSRDFSELWDFDVPPSTKKVAIVWSGETVFEDGSRFNFEPHVNPLAWAVCALDKRKDLEVLVLDSAHKRHHDESRVYRLVQALQPERMPWLRVVSLNEFGRFLVEREAGKAASEAGSRDDLLKMLSQQMREELTEEGKENNRHAIQNIVGPMVLLGREHIGTRGVAERALLQVFETSGLLAKEQARNDQPLRPIKEDSWGDQPLRLLLVDDQADCGWEDWVRSNLPASKPNLVTLDVLTSPEPLLDSLAAEQNLREYGLDRRFEFELPGSAIRSGSSTVAASPRQTILLLDLRLHSTRSTQSEAEFLKRLLSLCGRFKTGGKATQFAWPGFSPHELQSVQRWCENAKRERETNEHFLGLSLLPRLLALFDMSLPIILFSSTGRRNLIQYFEDYGNIVTTFEKPRFFGGDSQDAVAATKRKFRQAIREAVRIASARRFCQGLLAEDRSAIHPRTFVFRDNPTLADVYIDESGFADEPHFAVGGLVLLYTREKKNALQAALKSRRAWSGASAKWKMALNGLAHPYCSRRNSAAMRTPTTERNTRFIWQRSISASRKRGCKLCRWAFKLAGRSWVRRFRASQRQPATLCTDGCSVKFWNSL